MHNSNSRYSGLESAITMLNMIQPTENIWLITARAVFRQNTEIYADQHQNWPEEALHNNGNVVFTQPLALMFFGHLHLYGFIIRL